MPNTMIDNIDPSRLLNALSQFFDVSKKALCLIFAVMTTSLVTATIDYNEPISAIPRWSLAIFYLFGMLCFFYLTALAISSLFTRGQEMRAERTEVDERESKALRNLGGSSNLHQACLVFLKRRNQKRFSDEWWNTLGGMAGSGFLDVEQAAHDTFWYEVPDAIGDSPILAQWVVEYRPFEDIPWLPQNMMHWS